MIQADQPNRKNYIPQRNKIEKLEKIQVKMR